MQPTTSNPRRSHSPYDTKISRAHLFVHFCVKSDVHPPAHAVYPKSNTLIGKISLLYPIELLKISSLPVLDYMICLMGLQFLGLQYLTSIHDLHAF